MNKKLPLTAFFCFGILNMIIAQNTVTSVVSGNGTTVDNTAPAAPVINLGATLTSHINFDLGAGYNFYFKKGSSNYFTLLNNGNSLFGTGTDNGNLLQVNGSTYSRLFTNSTVALGDINAGALRLRWGGGGGSYIDFYNNSSTSLRGSLGSASDTRPLWLRDLTGVTFLNTPFVAVGAEYAMGDYAVLGVINTGSSVNSLSIGRSGTQTNTYDFAIKSSGNVLIGSNSDNGNKFQVTGNSYLNGTLKIGNIPANNALTGLVVTDGSGNLAVRDVSTVANSISWNVAGNTGTTPATQFVGTTDNQRLAFRTNNVENVSLMPSGNLLVGTTTDNGNRLQVNGNSYFNGNFNFSNTNPYAAGNGSLFSAGIGADGRWGIYYSSNGYSNSYPMAQFRNMYMGLGMGSSSVNLTNYGLNAPLETSAEGVHAANLIFGYNSGPGNVSRLRIHVSDIGEFNNYNGAYPSGVNYYQIETELLGPTTSTNTGQTAVRAPLYLGGRFVKFNAGITSTEAMRIDQSGNLGIGISTPTAQLHTTGTVRFAGLTSMSSPVNVLVSDANGNVFYATPSSLGTSIGSVNAWAFNGSAVSSVQNIGTTTTYDLPFITANTERMRIKSTGNIIINSTTDNGSLLQVNGTGYFSGNVGIGTAPQASFQLAVEGVIGARKVKVTLASPWADYVFEPGYSLSSLPEVEKYINNNKHLQDVPSAAEVEKDGIDLGSNQAILLKKIEELTLYAIEQNKMAEKQDKKIKELEEKLNRLLEQKK